MEQDLVILYTIVRDRAGLTATAVDAQVEEMNKRGQTENKAWRATANSP